MKLVHFPKPFEHVHPPVKDVNDLFEKQSTFGQRAADKVARIAGSWTFIIVQSAILIFWAFINVTAWIRHWDPYPFILMNLFLSLQAAYTAPVIMMSQNRQSQKDRIAAQNDYVINQKAEKEIRAVLDHLTAQDEAIQELQKTLLFIEEKSNGGEGDNEYKISL